MELDDIFKDSVRKVLFSKANKFLKDPILYCPLCRTELGIVYPDIITQFSCCRKISITREGDKIDIEMV